MSPYYIMRTLSIYYVIKQIYLTFCTSNPVTIMLNNSYIPSNQNITTLIQYNSLTRVVLDEHTVIFTKYTKHHRMQILSCVQYCTFDIASVSVNVLECNHFYVNVLVFPNPEVQRPLSHRWEQKPSYFKVKTEPTALSCPATPAFRRLQVATLPL